MSAAAGAGAGSGANALSFEFADKSVYDRLPPGPPLVFEPVASKYTVEDLQGGLGDPDKEPIAVEEVISIMEAQLRGKKLEARDNRLYYKDVPPRSLSTFKLPIDSVVYRYDKTGKQSPSSKIPAFFGNRETTQIYSGSELSEEETRSAYKSKREALLLDWNYNTLDLLAAHPALSEKDIDFLEQYYVPKSGPHTLKLPDGDMNIMINSPAPVVLPCVPFGTTKGGYTIYLNRIMAKIVCKLGLDGWVVRPFDPAKKAGVLKWVIAESALSFYNPEIMLCKWGEVMDRIDTVGGSRRRLRKTRRAHQKK